MEKVRPKKHLGQHFLTDLSIAKRIAQAVTGHGGAQKSPRDWPWYGRTHRFLARKPTGALFGRN